MDRRKPAVPTARAISLYARTVVRELRRASYSQADLLTFVNEVMDRIARDAKDDASLRGIADPETRLANVEVLIEVLDFEMQRARDGAHALLVLAMELHLPDWTADDVSHTLHVRFAEQIEWGVRPSDTASRIGASRYVVVVPGAQAEHALAIAQRLVRSFVDRSRKDDALPAGTRLVARWASFDGGTASTRSPEPTPSVESAESLLARAMAAPSHELLLQGDDSHPPPSRMSPNVPKVERSERDIVLALGGGLARAAAHVGVLAALRKVDARIVGIAGTSAGALVGAMWLSGMHEDEILERMKSFPASDAYKRIRRQYVSYRRASTPRRSVAGYFRQSGIAFVSEEGLAAVDDETFEATIAHFVHDDVDIATLSAPFVSTATDISNARSVTFTTGPIRAAVRASCAVPGFFRPQRFGDRILVDGAMTSEVPIHAALSLGLAAPVVGIHLARPDRRVSDFTSSLEVITRTSSLVHKELVREQLRRAPIITADVADIPWLDFRRASETAKAGYEATLSQLPHLLGGRFQ